MEYFCDSNNYLKRAEACLEKNDPQYLFYAALELRCFIENRQNDYLEAQEKYRKSLPKRWKIGKQASELGRFFNLDKIQKITNIFEDGFQFVSLYVPVSKSLAANSVRLGELMHAQNDDLSEESLETFQSRLNNILKCAHECQSGNMLSPVLMDKSTGNSFGHVSLKLDQNDANEMKDRFQAGTKMVANVEYLEFEKTIQ
jgi:tetratricopeptide (TPR) repeat protein